MPRRKTASARLLWLLGALILVPPASADDKSVAIAIAGGSLRKVAAGLHDGDAFGPRIRPDGKWVAYGVREEDKGTFVTKYYARSLVEDGLFRSIWPNAHPSFSAEGDGTASFTDLMGFEWARDGKYDHNAMVARHKTKAEEVLVETMAVRMGGPGVQSGPAMAGDGTRMIVVSELDGQTDLWVTDLRDKATPLQLTFTDKDNESNPSWHPKNERIIYERRNRLGADVWMFDFGSFAETHLTMEGTSDEIAPTFSPDGKAFAYVTNGNDKSGLRWDLVVKASEGALPRVAIPNLRRSDKSVGYSWEPFGRFVIGVQDDKEAGYPLVIAPIDGSKPPQRLATTVDNSDPELVAFGPAVRLTWVALDMERDLEHRFRIVFVSDFDLAELRKLVGTE